MKKETKICTMCKKLKSTEAFYLRQVGKNIYPRTRCKKCSNKVRYMHIKSSSKAYRRERYKKNKERLRYRRRHEIGVGNFILQDSRGFDKKRGLKNNLTREFVDALIPKPCTYCECKDIRMTLDRINNKKGHMRKNVVPACIRCNYLRRDVPFEAWKKIVPGVKRAYQLGLFGKWTGRCR
jgi:hypothetical protein